MLVYIHQILDGFAWIMKTNEQSHHWTTVLNWRKYYEK